MPEFFASGRAVDVVLLVVLLEALLLTILSLRARGSFAALEIVLALLPGVLLLLALRAALLQLSWAWVAFFLLLSFPAHLADLRRRWRR